MVCSTRVEPRYSNHASGYTNNEVGLEWLEHFDKHTVKKTVGKKRLLILDGHGSHHTKEFIAYCVGHDIVPFGLPPNLKHYHAKPLDLPVRDGIVNITKIEFLTGIEAYASGHSRKVRFSLHSRRQASGHSTFSQF